MNRRALLAATALTLASAASASLRAQTKAPAGLLDPGPLPERELGNPAASVTVIEYASLTCHHCQDFHKTTWPAFKAKYVDTGLVRFILREFPLDPVATVGAMTARCSGDKWAPVIDLLFATGETWNHAPQPVEVLSQIMRQTGMSRDRFDACLKDEALFNGIRDTSRRAEAFGVNSTPTFFINGRKEVGALKMADLERIIDPLLARRAP